MTKCSFCGGSSDSWVDTLPSRLLSKYPYSKHPYCSRCGMLKTYIMCFSCLGRGYIYQDNCRGPRYCTHCGRRISKKVQCSVCHGTGRVSDHTCLREWSVGYPYRRENLPWHS